MWIAIAGAAINVPTGTVTPLENVNGRSARRVSPTVNGKGASVTEVRDKVAERTEACTTDTLGLS